MRLQTPLYNLWLALGSCVFAEETEARLTSAYICEEPSYRIHMVSTSPLIIYITNFLTENERAHLQAITYYSPHPVHILLVPYLLTPSSKDTFSSSGITGSQPHNPRIRTSQSATVPRDPVVACIERRALAFQGLDTPASHLEPLQLVRYAATQHFHFHTDWFPSPALASPERGGNRLTSFFAYVRVENGTTGGGTNFPMVDAPEDERWCEFVDCDEEWDKGTTFRPVGGNAVFWRNLLEDGRGDPRTVHAGLPVTSGGKIGMNVWTRQAPYRENSRGSDV